MTMRRDFHLTNPDRIREFGRRVASLESLETKVLLAGDTLASWQNQSNAYDVNDDQFVTSLDALSIIRDLNRNGSRQLVERGEGEPDSATGFYPDVNGDNAISSMDVLGVIRQLLPEGEGETGQFRLEVTDADGNPITTANVGDQIQLRGYIQDLRDASEATGFFVAYMDVTYDAALVNVAADGAIAFTPEFPNGTSGDTSTPGTIDEVGAFISGTSGFGSEENLLFTVTMQATAPGTVTFASDAADELPAHETIFFSPLDPVAEDDILFGSVDLTIQAAASEAADLVGFAQALADAGVEFWSTRQLSSVSAEQRAIFEDGADELPFRETFDAEGNLTADATTAGVTEVNTWIFPDGSSSSGDLLSLDEISQRSGVAIPGKTGVILESIDDITITNESPWHVPLDGYDPTNGPLTYTFTTDNEDLLDVRVLEGNRSWGLEVGGFGEMVFEFFEQRAPRATEQFITLTEDGFYEDIIFHRVIDEFVIQGGDPTGTGRGSSELPDFDDQFHVDLQHSREGVLSMAKAGDDTNNSQFFVTDVPTRFLDFNHTVFGQLVEGEEVRDAISNTPTAAGDRPVEDVVITSARVFTDTENAVLFVGANAGMTGSGNITVTVADSVGNETSQTFAVTVEEDATNSAPFLSDIADLEGAAGGTVTFQLEHTDIEGDDVFFFVEAVSADVTASVSEAGLVEVTIPADAEANSTVTVDVIVSQTNSRFASTRDEQRVDIRVVGTVEAGVDDDFTIQEDSVDVALDVLANDGVDEDAVITNFTSSGVSGEIRISEDGRRLLFSPASDFVGTESFQYTASTSVGDLVAMATVVVENVDDPPMAVDDRYPQDFAADSPFRETLREDATDSFLLAVLLNDSNLPDDPNQEIFTITGLGDAAGTISTNTFNISYTPAPDFFGEDSFTYTVTGISSGASATATVIVDVAEVNDAPVLQGEEFTLAAGESLQVATTDLLTNDAAGPDNEVDQTLVVTSILYDGDGTAELTDDGTITYTPAAGFVGVETITYVVEDDGTTAGEADPLASEATITITVEGERLALDDTFEVDSGSANNELDVLANDSDSTVLTITEVGTPNSGTVTIVGDATRLSYTPNVDFFGTDTFTYSVADGEGGTATANVVVNVLPETSLAVEDFFTIQGTTTLDVLENDIFGQGATSLSITNVMPPADGALSFNADATAITYEPLNNFVGADAFSYTITDDLGNSSTAVVSVTVEEVVVEPNNDPLAFDDQFDVISEVVDQPLDVLANDSTLPDTDEVLTIQEIEVLPVSGTAIINATGDTILYTPEPGFSGLDTLTYRIDDGNGGTDSATVEINVIAPVVNNDPLAFNDLFEVTADEANQVLDVLANDSALPDTGEILTIEAIEALPANGTAVISAAGDTILYTPEIGFAGSDTLTYRINDGNGGTDTASVDITVVRVDVPPIAQDDVFVVSFPGVQTFNVLSNDSGESGETLQITDVQTAGTRGTVEISGDGTSLSYTPDFTFEGTDTFTYTLSDGTGLTDQGEVTVEVPNLVGDSFFSGTVFSDRNRNLVRDGGEAGIAGVTIMLEGTDLAGNEVRRETKTNLDGSYRFDGIAPGRYTVTEQQPAFMQDGLDILAATIADDDSFDFTVSEQLITSDGNVFSEQGLLPQFAILDALSSSRTDGLTVVLDGDTLSWLESRGGWSDVDSVDVTMSGDTLTLQTVGDDGTESSTSISMSDRERVYLIGKSGSHTFLRINGSSQEVLSSAAVDEVFAG